MVPSNFRFQAEYAAKKQKARVLLLAWQSKINSITNGLPLIAVENEVDLEVGCVLLMSETINTLALGLIQVVCKKTDGSHVALYRNISAPV